METKEATIGQIRQGDVILLPITAEDFAVLNSGKIIPRENGSIVLAHGTATGHSHAIAAEGATMFEMKTPDEGDRLLSVEAEGVELKHEEHTVQPVPAHHYIVRRQREFDRAANRQVAD